MHQLLHDALTRDLDESLFGDTTSLTTNATTAESSQAKLTHSRELPGTATATRGPVHVSTLRSGFDPNFTLYTNLLSRLEIDPDGSHKLFGTRTVDFETGDVGPYEWVTLNEFLIAVKNCSSGMSQELGLHRGALVGIFSKNRYEWSVVEHSTNRMAYTLVPLWAPRLCPTSSTTRR
ncbi:hypothetical protein F443_12263 [Phytophthora nicotianae P1569]|uniref:AMP-dependent synthetase/ligase domain-containing protein n=1 Tax=Phytophthora nicotianae P1569 TaxID=1317065 RepID=V9EX60_PHYNI|nr:hypothetical protein F443_12263 [Phytophthora nicotianae P1569]